MVPGRAGSVKDERLAPKFQARSCGPNQKFGSPTRRLRRSLTRSLTRPSRPTPRARLSRTQGDETMTIEQHIEELRAEFEQHMRRSRAPPDRDRTRPCQGRACRAPGRAGRLHRHRAALLRRLTSFQGGLRSTIFFPDSTLPLEERRVVASLLSTELSSTLRDVVAPRPLLPRQVEEQSDGLILPPEMMDHHLPRCPDPAPAARQADFPEQRDRYLHRVEASHVLRRVGSFDVELVRLRDHAHRVADRRQSV